MAVGLEDIKKLRTMTGAGLGDCKKALTEANGDIEAAIEIIRKKGQAVAAKRSDREAAEGCVLCKYENGFAAIIALKCETDFVAKNADFVKLAQDILDVAVANKCKSLDEVKALPMAGHTVADAVTDRSGITGEKMELDGYSFIEGENVSVYDHMGRHMLCTMVQTNKPAEEQAHNIAMQVAAMNPVALDEASVPAEVVEHEKTILAAQMKEDPKMASKPEAVLAKIAAGKMGKYYKENCLVDQEFVRSDLFQGDVKGYVASVAKELGTEIKLNGFIRMMKGDGLEKREENFAEEIAKQING